MTTPTIGERGVTVFVRFVWRKEAGGVAGDGVKLGAYLAAVAGVLGGAALLPAWLLAADAGPVAAGEWREIARPRESFALEGPEVARWPAHYAAYRHVEGRGRRDVMTHGNVADGAFLRVVVHRTGSERPDARGALFDGPMPSGGVRRGAVTTKFGEIAADELRDGARACLVAAERFPAAGLEIAAVMCNAGPETIDRGRLACAVDRLMLLSAGGDGAIADLFQQAELARTACAGEDRIGSATPVRATWIDGRRGPGLRETMRR